MKATLRRWLVAGLVIVALAGFGFASGGQGLAHEDEESSSSAPTTVSAAMPLMPDQPAFIYRGGCDDIADVAFPLAPVAFGAPLVPGAAPAQHTERHDGANHDVHGAPASAVGAAAAVPGASSSTIVPVGLTDLLASDHAIAVLGNELDGADAAIACGALGGVVADGDLVVGLHEMNDSGAVGMAWLRDNGDGATTVMIMLAHGLFAQDEAGEAILAPASAVETETVAVTLTEFAISVPETTFATGVPYRFEITNAGTVPHEFVIERVGASHEPLTQGSAVAMVHAIAPGATATLDWTFAEPGAYQLACHEPGHYESGQALAVEVVGL